MSQRIAELIETMKGGPGSGPHPSKSSGEHEKNVKDMHSGHTLVEHTTWNNPGGKTVYKIQNPSGERVISANEHSQLRSALSGKLSVVKEVNAPGAASVTHYRIPPGMRETKSLTPAMEALLKGGPGSGPHAGVGSTEEKASLAEQAKTAEEHQSAANHHDLEADKSDGERSAVSHDRAMNAHLRALEAIKAGSKNAEQLSEKARSASARTNKMYYGSSFTKSTKSTKALRGTEYNNLADAIKSRVETLKCNHGYTYAVSQLQVALNTAETNAPINEAEGNTAQAALERIHATSFREAINLLSSGKSLPDELFNSIKATIDLYVDDVNLSALKGGPGSGRHAGSGAQSKAENASTKEEHLAAVAHHTAMAEKADNAVEAGTHENAASYHQDAADSGKPSDSQDARDASKEVKGAKDQAKLYDAHQREAEKQGSTVHNFGAGVTKDSIYSKTSHGGLESNRDSVTGKITHKWM